MRGSKGNGPTKEWGSMMHDLEDTLLARNDKDRNTEMANEKMRQLLGKNMHQISKSQDVSKEGGFNLSFWRATQVQQYNCQDMFPQPSIIVGFWI
jgi:hypothetical protein